jgi:hypothetical protein
VGFEELAQRYEQFKAEQTTIPTLSTHEK